MSEGAPFTTFLLFLLALSFCGNDEYTRSPNPIEPSLELNCTNGVCDTTYIYKNVRSKTPIIPELDLYYKDSTCDTFYVYEIEGK